MECEVIKTLIRSDGKRRVQVFRRGDGLFGFSTKSGEPCWTPCWPADSPIFDSAETAEREARARIDWLCGQA